MLIYLPDCNLIECLQYLEYKEIIQCQNTIKTFYNLISNNKLVWKYIELHFNLGQLKPSKLFNLISKYHIYIENAQDVNALPNFNFLSSVKHLGLTNNPVHDNYEDDRWFITFAEKITKFLNCTNLE